MTKRSSPLHLEQRHDTLCTSHSCDAKKWGGAEIRKRLLFVFLQCITRWIFVRLLWAQTGRMADLTQKSTGWERGTTCFFFGNSFVEDKISSQEDSLSKGRTNEFREPVLSYRAGGEMWSHSPMWVTCQLTSSNFGHKFPTKEIYLSLTSFLSQKSSVIS